MFYLLIVNIFLISSPTNAAPSPFSAKSLSSKIKNMWTGIKQNNMNPFKGWST